MDEAQQEIRSADLRRQRSEEELKLARLALQKAAERNEQYLMFYCEYLARSNTVLTARLANISAWIDHGMGIVRYLGRTGHS